jgi:hypothetical protein
MTSLRRVLLLLGAATLVGCDVPTDPPRVEQRWIVPLDNAGIPVDEFLPEGVGLGGDLFEVTVDAFTVETTLGELCAACVDGAGPVRAFQGTLSGSQTFPEDVTAAVLEAGSITVAVQNGLSFDPTAGGGSLEITITDGPGGKTIGQATISTGLPPGATVARGITLAGGSVQPTLAVSTLVTSVGGQTSAVDTSEKLIMTVEPLSVQAGFVTVNVAGRVVHVIPEDLDVSDVDETISDHIESGEMRVDIANPFSVAMTLTLNIDYPGGSLSRTVDVPGDAVSTVSVSYTADEFRSFLGKEGVVLTGTGLVSSSEGPTLLRTDETMVLAATLDLTLVIG